MEKTFMVVVALLIFGCCLALMCVVRESSRKERRRIQSVALFLKIIEGNGIWQGIHFTKGDYRLEWYVPRCKATLQLQLGGEYATLQFTDERRVGGNPAFIADLLQQRIDKIGGSNENVR